MGGTAFPSQPRAPASVPPAVGVSIDQYLGALSRMRLIHDARSKRAHVDHRFRYVRFAAKRVLDIGAGDGFYAFYAALAGAREVVALEPEAAGVPDGARARFDRIRELLPDVPVRLEPMGVEQYRDAEGFDVILMNASINHIDEDACVRLHKDAAARAAFTRVFAHIATLARPRARLLITDCARRNFFPAVGLTNPFVRTIEWHKHQAPGLWAALLAEAGFVNPRVRWESLYRFGGLMRASLSNAAAAYFLKSAFILEMDKR